MRKLVVVTVSVIYLAAISPAVQAQDCSSWNPSRIAGTYAGSGSGSADFSKIVPGFPSGLTPISWVGAFTFDAAGGGGGWVSMNTAGTQTKAQLTDVKYTVQADCSILWTLTLKQKDMGLAIPMQRAMVIVPRPTGLELHMIVAGSDPGQPPVPAFDSGVIYRVFP